VNLGALGEGVGIRRINCDGLREIVNGLVVLAHEDPAVSAAIIGVRLLWTDPDRFIEINDCFVETTLTGSGEGATDESGGTLWVEAEGLVKIGDGRVVVLERTVGTPPLDIRARRLRVLPHRFFGCLERRETW